MYVCVCLLYGEGMCVTAERVERVSCPVPVGFLWVAVLSAVLALLVGTFQRMEFPGFRCFCDF